MKKELNFIYIAKDGKKFTSKIDAIEYEKKHLMSKSILKKQLTATVVS